MLKQTYTNPQQFISRLKWQTLQDELTDMRFLILDCFKFEFEPPLEKQPQYDLLHFINGLELNDEAILQICAWLDDHNIKFKLKFQYDRNRSLWYNIQKRKIEKIYEKIIKLMRDGRIETTRRESEVKT